MTDLYFKNSIQEYILREDENDSSIQNLFLGYWKSYTFFKKNNRKRISLNWLNVFCVPCLDVMLV